MTLTQAIAHLEELIATCKDETDRVSYRTERMAYMDFRDGRPPVTTFNSWQQGIYNTAFYTAMERYRVEGQ